MSESRCATTAAIDDETDGRTNQRGALEIAPSSTPANFRDAIRPPNSILRRLAEAVEIDKVCGIRLLMIIIIYNKSSYNAVKNNKHLIILLWSKILIFNVSRI